MVVSWAMQWVHLLAGQKVVWKEIVKVVSMDEMLVGHSAAYSVALKAVYWVVY